MGVDDQLQSQAAYIFTGNYGLASLEELQESGLSAQQALDVWRWKLRFAYDRIRGTDELLDLRRTDRGPVELAPGVVLERRGLNRYQFRRAGQSIDVDLTLQPGEKYLPPYELPVRRIGREFFSVVHIGEGDGWDPDRPCMGSLLCHQGRYYLIDAGPGITRTLDALGITPNEIEGIFQTHCHDDHFAGLTSLARTDHRIPYYAAPLVREGVARKLSALMEVDTAMFAHSFRVVDLALDRWTSVKGLEVMPVLSPHPVDNTVLYFRALGPDGYREYAHLGDIPSLSVLDRMVTPDGSPSGVRGEFRDRFRSRLLAPVHLKKVDAGGGPIHGDPADFTGDTSARLLLSHTDRPLSGRDLAVGVQASFGETDVLIRTSADVEAATRGLVLLQEYFPRAPRHELEILANCPPVSFEEGEQIVEAGAVSEDLYFLLGGIVDARSPGGPVRRLSAGALCGEITAIAGEPVSATHVAATSVSALRIPLATCRAVIERNGLAEAMERLRARRIALEGFPVFSEMLSFHVLQRLARTLERMTAHAGETPERRGCLALLLEGCVRLATGAGTVEEIGPGGVWGEDELLCRASPVEAHATTEVEYLLMPRIEVTAIPIVTWKLLEICDRRRKHPHARGGSVCAGD